MDTKLSDAEQVFIIHGMQLNFRNDGRSCRDFRPIVLETGVVDSTNGSARVQCGSTDVLVGVKAEIGPPPDPSRPEDGTVRFFVDCSANATPEFEGRGGEGIAEDLTAAFTTAVAGNPIAFNPAQLSIVSKHFAWTLHIDILLLECAGNLFDLASLAVAAAMADAKLPSVSVLQNEKAEPIIELSDDPMDTWGLDLTGWPLFVSVHKVGTANAVDLTLEEEQVSLSTLLLAVAPTTSTFFALNHGSSADATKNDSGRPALSSSSNELENMDTEGSNIRPVASNLRPDSSNPKNIQTEHPDSTSTILMARQMGRGSLEVDSILEMTQLGLSVGRLLHKTLANKLKGVGQSERVGFL